LKNELEMILMKSDDTAKARAEAIFRPVTPVEKLSPMDEYKARQTAERQKMERLRVMRLAREARSAK
jgi:hypothetical protein